MASMRSKAKDTATLDLNLGLFAYAAITVIIPFASLLLGLLGVLIVQLVSLPSAFGITLWQVKLLDDWLEKIGLREP